VFFHILAFTGFRAWAQPAIQTETIPALYSLQQGTSSKQNPGFISGKIQQVVLESQYK
jgi:hypothetical protein